MSEIEAFRAELRAAGQPWSRWGIVLVVIGMIALGCDQFIGQAAPYAELFFPILLASVALLAVGWVMLIVAMLRRRRWAKTHDLEMPRLSDANGGAG